MIHLSGGHYPFEYTIVYEAVTAISLLGQEKKGITEKSIYTSRKIIIANGCTPNKPGIEGEFEFKEKGIGLNAPKHGLLYKKMVLV